MRKDYFCLRRSYARHKEDRGYEGSFKGKEGYAPQLILAYGVAVVLQVRVHKSMLTA